VIRGPAPLALSLALGLVVTACGASAATPPAAAPTASPMPAGTYTTASFKPAVTFTVPDGWQIATDSESYFQVRRAGQDVVGIHLFRDPLAASQDPACPTTTQPGVGKSSTELVTWMRSLKGLTVGAPVMSTVGGLPGVAVDVRIAAGWTQSCAFANGLPTVPLLTDGVDLRWIVAGSERLRLYLVDLPGGGTVIVDLDAFDGDLFDSLVKDAVPVLKTFRFATG
jgi:hypothetical protein